LDEDQGNTRQRSESQLSVILEQSNHNGSKMGGANNNSRTINESIETGESIENGTKQ